MQAIKKEFENQLLNFDDYMNVQIQNEEDEDEEELLSQMDMESLDIHESSDDEVDIGELKDQEINHNVQDAPSSFDTNIQESFDIPENEYDNEEALNVENMTTEDQETILKSKLCQPKNTLELPKHPIISQEENNISKKQKVAWKRFHKFFDLFIEHINLILWSKYAGKGIAYQSIYDMIYLLENANEISNLDLKALFYSKDTLRNYLSIVNSIDESVVESNLHDIIKFGYILGNHDNHNLLRINANKPVMTQSVANIILDENVDDNILLDLTKRKYIYSYMY